MKSKWKKQMCIGLILILVFSIAAAALQTDFGHVKIKDLYIVTDDQQYMHALAFIPKTATPENPCPVVVTSHGWLNSGEVQDAASIELSRRGIMVIAMDAYSHGLSSNVINETRSASAAQYAMGMIDLVEYVHSSVLNFVDTSRVGVMGHSMGGNNSWMTIRHFGRLYKAAAEDAELPESDGGAEITEEEQAKLDELKFYVYAALPTGSKPTYNDGRWDEIFTNVGCLYGALEEGGYSASTGNGRIVGDAVEGVEMINSGLPEGQKITSVEEGKFYGNKEDGTLRVIYQPKITHPLIHFDPASTADVISFFTYVFDIHTTLGPKNQTFLLKEIFNGIAMVGLFMLLWPTCEMFLATPFFAELKAEKEPPLLPALTPESKKKFILGIVLGGAVSFVTAILTMPVYRAIFADTVAGKPGALFNASTMNCVMTWTFFNAVWGFFWFWFNFKKDKAAGVRTDEMIGWKISGRQFWKSLLLAGAIVGFVYAIVWFCKWMFNTDFRFWTPAIKTFQAGKLIEYFQYWPVFLAFYIANGLAVNGAMRVDGMNEKKNLFICGLSNIIGCGLIWALQYGALITRGTVIWQKEWIDVLVIAFCVWQLFLAPFIMRKFFKSTGKVWVGGMVVSAMYVLCGLMHTCITSTLF